jgi:hypothetical protein
VQLGYVTTGNTEEYYHYNPATDSTNFRSQETQQPNLFLGWHHEWSPGVNTLFLATRQVANQSDSNTNGLQNVAVAGSSTIIANQPYNYFNQSAGLNTKENSVELQQIWEQDSHTTIIGSRYDWGNVDYANSELLNDYEYYFSLNPTYQYNQNFSLNYEHFDVYGYHTWQIVDSLAITAGLSYDWLRHPTDPATTPFVDPYSAGSDYTLAQQEGLVNSQETSQGQLSPKAGLVWTPTTSTVVRAAYTRSLSGFGNGQNNQLQPTEVAGFNQAYHSLIPESAAGIGDTSGSRFDTFDASFEQKFPTGTYLILSGQALYSKLSDTMGSFVYFSDSMSGSDFYTYPLGLRQTLNYRERTVAMEVDQLLGEQWTIGSKYTLSQANLSVDYPQMSANLASKVNESPQSILQTVALHANWNHPSGLFSILEATWYHQDNADFAAAEPGDAFWQLNAYGGYRFWHRKVEVSVGVLNLTDQNYQLEPLNLYNETARSRTFLARLLISF